MSKRYLTVGENGQLSITEITGEDPKGIKLTKTLFELSRTTDMTTKFDASKHTREIIAAGLTGHRALSVMAECEHTDVPTDRYFRDAWEWSE